MTTLEQCARHATQHEARVARPARCSPSMAGRRQPNPTQLDMTKVIAMEQNAQAQAKPMKIPGPEHPISVERNSSRVVVSVAGRVIADTREALTLDEAHYPAVQYIPRKDVDMAQLTRSDRTTYCPYKGDAAYFSIPVGGEARSMRCGATRRPMRPSPASRITLHSTRIGSTRSRYGHDQSCGRCI